MEFKHFAGPGFEMQIPTDWYISSSPDFQAIFISPEENGDEGKANLVISLAPVAKDFCLPEACQAFKESGQELFKDAELILAEESKLDDHPAYQYLYKVPLDESDKKVILRQFICVGKAMMLNLTASRIAGPAPELDATLAKMIVSFKFN